MRIAVAQMSTRAGDFARTSERMVEQSRRAAADGADLLVFPSAALAGASPVGAGDQEGFLLDLAECLTGLAGGLACPCLVPVPTDFDGVPTSEAMLVAEGAVTPVRLTAHLEALSAAQASGQEADLRPLPELAFAGARLGIAFTYDDLDDYVEYDYDVDVIVYLPSLGFAVDDPSSALGMALAEGRFVADAEATGAWIVAAGPLGCYDAQVFCGSSFVLAPWGELAAQAPSFEEALLVCDVDPSAEGPLEAPLAFEVYDAPLATWGALTLGLGDLAARAGASELCVRVDETLGSMLVATLATDALGPTHVHALVVEGEATGASALVRNLRLPEGNVERFDAGGLEPPLGSDLAEARLADLARRVGGLALGAADKTSLALDAPCGVSAARLLPLGDLYRTSVVALAHLRNTISPVIPPAAGIACPLPVAAGLAGELPSPEAFLEFVDLVLTAYVEWGRSLSDIVSERGHAGLVAAVVARLHETEGLRPDLGMALALSTKTLAEARGPQGLAWHDRVRAADERLDAVAIESLARMRGGEKGAGAGTSASGGGPAAAAHGRDVRDLFGYLRDFSAGGGFVPPDPAGSGSRGGERDEGSHPFWAGPFSQN